MSKLIDITNQRFGSLVALEYVGNQSWLCQCDCGKQKVIRAHSLRSGLTKSCGECNLIPILIGQHFGEWEVIEYSGNGYYKCKCSCGVIKDVQGKYLRSGTSKSCGHKYDNSLIGKQFGDWTVLKYAGKNRYLCQCICGNQKEVLTQHLKNGRSKGCGCASKERKQQSFKQTMQTKYNEISTKKINNPREQWILDTLNNQEKFKEFLIKYYNKYGSKPTINQLTIILKTSYSNIQKAIHRYSLEEYTGMYNEFSELEKELYDYIKSIYNGKILENNRTIIPPLELDIFLPDKNIAIEFNGTYWHSDKVKPKDYHRYKSLKCAEHRIQLIHIYEYEWLNNKDMIKQYLKDILQENNRIYAKDTTIGIPSIEEEREFLNNNHLQGYVASSIKYGLYYNSELIGIMTFGNPRFNNNYQYELIRLAWKSGITVIGGAEKLFKYFVFNYKPISIISYCDFSKFLGNIYSRLGFKISDKKFTPCNYVWIDRNNQVIPRYKTMKSKLISQNLGTLDMTEVEIMESLGCYRVFDCGNLIFEWHSNINADYKI